MRRVLGLDGEDQMPLDADPLPEATIAQLRAWIDQGAAMPGAPELHSSAATAGTRIAADPEHWAYVKPTRPELPPVARTAWARNAIDRFVLARLEREKLSPSPEASKATLLRRVTLDLIGLPPTPAEVDAFLADAAPDAYEQRRRSAARLAALRRTLGAAVARSRALRRHQRLREGRPPRASGSTATGSSTRSTADMPFDQFTIEQIAGDMLPDATDAQQHRHRLSSQHDDQRRRRRRSGRVDVRGARRSRQHHGHGLARHDARAARSATTTSTIRSARRTTSGCSPSSPTRTTKAGRPATALASPKPGSTSRRPSRSSRAGSCRPTSTVSSRS